MSLPAGSVCLDAQGAQLNPGRGIARYISEQMRALVALSPEAIGAVRVNPAHPLPPEWADLELPLVGWRQRNGNRSDRRLAAPIYHVMSPFDPLQMDDVLPPRARREAQRRVVTLYDLIPLLMPEHYLRNPLERGGYMARLGMIRKADAVLALSQVTADDAVDHIGVDAARITVIEAGVSPGLSALAPDRKRAAALLRAELPAVRDGYVLYVGGADERKNLRRLIAGYGLLPERLRQAHQLVIACALDEHWAGLLRGWIADANLDPSEVLVTGFVSDPQLAALYRTCELFAFPSLYEGFGLPIVEASACGAPVLASRSSTTAEVLGELSGTFDASDSADISRALEQHLTSRDRLAALRRRSERLGGRFTWERVATRTLEAYERVLDRPASRPRPPRRARVAIFTPWPPERSGIADYNRRLVAELGRLADVDVVVGGEEGDYLADGAGLLSARRFAWRDRLRPADRMLFCIGNSVMHAHAYEALLERDGVVVAHDVRLSGLYQPYAELADPADPDGWFARRLRHMYGAGAPAIPRLELPWSEEARESGLLMSGEVQASATRVLVHSREALEMLAADRLPPGAARPPVDLIPFGVPEPPRRRPRRPAPGDPLILCSGSISPAKPLEIAIEAFATVARERRGARLAIVGHATPERLESLRVYAAGLGVGREVEVHGRVDADAYWDLLLSAALGLQLREVSNGEASAAVTDCIAARLPLLVTDVGWYGELPGGVAARVPPGVAAAELGEQMRQLLDDRPRLAEMRDAQRDYAARNSFAAVAEAYAAALEL